MPPPLQLQQRSAELAKIEAEVSGLLNRLPLVASGSACNFYLTADWYGLPGHFNAPRQKHELRLLRIQSCAFLPQSAVAKHGMRLSSRMTAEHSSCSLLTVACLLHGAVQLHAMLYCCLGKRRSRSP